MGKRDQMALFLLAAVFFMLIFIIFIIEMKLSYHPINMFVFIIPFSAGALVGGHLYHDRLWLRLAVFYFIYGTVLSLIPFFDLQMKMHLMLAGLGVITLVTGLIRLRRFLKTYPRSGKERAHVTQG